MEPRQIGDRNGSALLQINLLPLPSRRKQPVWQRRRGIGCGSGELGEKARIVARLPKDSDQRRRDLQSSRDVPEVERHGGPDEAGQIGRLETILEGPNPLRLRHAPQRVACYYTGNVLTEPGAYQTRVYILGDPLEIGINLRIGGIGISKSIVLIGGKGELAAGNAA